MSPWQPLRGQYGQASRRLTPGALFLGLTTDALASCALGVALVESNRGLIGFGSLGMACPSIKGAKGASFEAIIGLTLRCGIDLD